MIALLAARRRFFHKLLIGSLCALTNLSCILELEPAAVDCVSTIDCGEEKEKLSAQRKLQHGSFCNQTL